MSDIAVVELTGGPRERGRAHGEALRTHIHEMVGPWVELVQRVTGTAMAEVAADFRATTRFDAAMTEHTPALLEELAGIAETAGIDPGVLFMYNCTDESDWYLRHRRLGAPLPDPRGCSSAAVDDSADGVVRGAQNMDIPSAASGRLAMLHLTGGDEPEAWVFTVAGLLGIMGMNATPIAAANNSLRSLACRVDGLPVNAVVRGVLAQSSYRDALDFVTSVPHASGQTHLLGTDGRFDLFECSANGAAEVAPDRGRATHTNHPLVSDDESDDERFRVSRSSSDTHARLASLDQQLRSDAPPGLSDLIRALSSHDDPDNPVCRHVDPNPGRNYTAGSVVYELGAGPVMHLAPGPPCETPLEPYHFA